jgi:hypothetical protein
VHSYARYELLMQRIMARAIGADGSAVILLTRTMTFTQNATHCWLCCGIAASRSIKSTRSAIA